MSGRNKDKSEMQESVLSFHGSLIKRKIDARNRKKEELSIMAIRSQNLKELDLLRHIYQLIVIRQPTVICIFLQTLKSLRAKSYLIILVRRSTVDYNK